MLPALGPPVLEPDLQQQVFISEAKKAGEVGRVGETGKIDKV